MRSPCRAVAAATLCALAALALPCRATKPTRECIAAHTEGQVERDAGKLLSAEQRFLACGAEVCPAMIRKECDALGQRVKEATPSIVLVIQDSKGRDVPGARVTIDGARSIEQLDGRPIELDPGEHRFEFVLPDSRRQTTSITLPEAQKYRRVVATFAASEPPARARASSPTPLAYVLGGVGLVALGSGVGFALDGRHKQTVLERCAPHCARPDVNAMRKSYLIADTSFGISLLSLGTSAYFFLRRTTEPAESAATFWIGASGRF